MKKMLLSMLALVSLLHAGYGQNYMEDFFAFKRKADSIIISLTSEKFLADNYYLSVEKSNPFSGQGSFGTQWKDTLFFKAHKLFPKAYDYVYLIRNINEKGIRITIEREQGALKEFLSSGYDYLCFVDGIPLDTSARPRDFLSLEKIRTLVMRDKKTTDSVGRIAFNWDGEQKGGVRRGIYHYEARSYITENNKRYRVISFMDPRSGKVMKKEKEEYGEDFDKPFSPVNH